MALNTWDENEPADTDLEGDGAAAMRSWAALIRERLELDHNFSGILDTADADCDGYHKKVTLAVQSSDPSALADAGIEYTKTVTVTFTGTSSNGSKVITSCSSVVGLEVGMTVAGTNIAAGSKIASIDSATQITLDTNATGTNSGLTATTVGLYFRNSAGIVRIA